MALDDDSIERDEPNELDGTERHALPMAVCGVMAVVAPMSAMAVLHGIFARVNAQGAAAVSGSRLAYGLAVVLVGSASFLALLLALYRPGRPWAWRLGLAALLANVFNPYCLVFLAIALPLWIVGPTRRHFGL